MHLLVITAVQSYEKDIRRLLKEHNVNAFSYMDVTGYKDVPRERKVGNWFASDMGEHQSTLFYAFVENGSTQSLMASIEAFNLQQKSQSHIHAALMEAKEII